MKTCFLHLLAKKKRTKEQGVCVWGGGDKKSLMMFNRTENGKFARNNFENSIFSSRKVIAFHIGFAVIYSNIRWPY